MYKANYLLSGRLTADNIKNLGKKYEYREEKGLNTPQVIEELQTAKALTEKQHNKFTKNNKKLLNVHIGKTAIAMAIEHFGYGEKFTLQEAGEFIVRNIVSDLVTSKVMVKFAEDKLNFLKSEEDKHLLMSIALNLLVGLGADKLMERKTPLVRALILASAPELAFYKLSLDIPEHFKYGPIEF